MRVSGEAARERQHAEQRALVESRGVFKADLVHPADVGGDASFARALGSALGCRRTVVAVHGHDRGAGAEPVLQDRERREQGHDALGRVELVPDPVHEPIPEPVQHRLQLDPVRHDVDPSAATPSRVSSSLISSVCTMTPSALL